MTETSATSEAPEPKKSKIPLLCATVLVSELIVLYFILLTGWGLRPIPFGWLAAFLGLIAVVCIAACATLPRKRGENRPGILLGWIVQLLILGLAVVFLPSLVIVLAFGPMWWAAVYWGRRMDRENTEWGR